MTKKNFTEELAELLEHVEQTAIAIRSFSTYGGGHKRPDAARHVEILSDSIHNLDMLGKAVKEGIDSNIVSACDFHIREYEELCSDPAMDGFFRNRQIGLRGTINIFRRIREKAVTMGSKQ